MKKLYIIAFALLVSCKAAESEPEILEVHKYLVSKTDTVNATRVHTYTGTKSGYVKFYMNEQLVGFYTWTKGSKPITFHSID